MASYQSPPYIKSGDLVVCNVCWSVVHPNDQEKHNRWHSELIEFIGRAANGFR